MISPGLLKSIVNIPIGRMSMPTEKERLRLKRNDILSMSRMLKGLSPIESPESAITRPISTRLPSEIITPSYDEGHTEINRPMQLPRKLKEIIPALAGMGGRFTTPIIEPEGMTHTKEWGEKAKSLVDQKIQGRYATLAQIYGILKGAQKEELKYKGVDDYLQGKEKIDKQEFTEYLSGKALELKENWRSGKYDPTEQEIQEYIDTSDGATRNEAIAAIQDDLAITSGIEPESTKFSQYQLPGGENYKELLLTMPDTSEPYVAPEEITELPDYLTYIHDQNGKESGREWAVVLKDQVHGRSFTNRYYASKEEARDEAIAQINRVNEYKAEREYKEKEKGYQSSHWEEPNILVHIRMNDRQVGNEKVLFIEELQSDWHSEGRKKGYAGQPQTESQYINKAEVPDAPFKKNWQEVGLKRIVKHAKEQGYDRISWTTGEQQADRYNLSKKISDISYRKTPTGLYSMYVTDNNNEVVYKESSGITIGEVENLVGKDIARKIENNEGKEVEGAFGIRALSGLDLKVGGEWAKRLYDEKIPSVLKKLTGNKVEEIAIKAPEGAKPTSYGHFNKWMEAKERGTKQQSIKL